jgi:hypothetical protein
MAIRTRTSLFTGEKLELAVPPVEDGVCSVWRAGIDFRYDELL